MQTAAASSAAAVQLQQRLCLSCSCLCLSWFYCDFPRDYRESAGVREEWWQNGGKMSDGAMPVLCPPSSRWRTERWDSWWDRSAGTGITGICVAYEPHTRPAEPPLFILSFIILRLQMSAKRPQEKSQNNPGFAPTTPWNQPDFLSAAAEAGGDQLYPGWVKITQSFIQQQVQINNVSVFIQPII